MEEYNNDSIFDDLNYVLNFFQNGLIRYSPDKNDYEVLELKTYDWKVLLLKAKSIKSSFFGNSFLFSKGLVKFDNAL